MVGGKNRARPGKTKVHGIGLETRGDQQNRIEAGSFSSSYLNYARDTHRDYGESLKTGPPSSKGYVVTLLYQGSMRSNLGRPSRSAIGHVSGLARGTGVMVIRQSTLKSALITDRRFIYSCWRLRTRYLKCVSLSLASSIIANVILTNEAMSTIESPPSSPRSREATTEPNTPEALDSTGQFAMLIPMNKNARSAIEATARSSSAYHQQFIGETVIDNKVTKYFNLSLGNLPQFAQIGWRIGRGRGSLQNGATTYLLGTSCTQETEVLHSFAMFFCSWKAALSP